MKLWLKGAKQIVQVVNNGQLCLTKEDMKSPDRHPKNALCRLDLSPSAQDFNCFNPGSKNASTQTGKQNDLSGTAFGRSYFSK